MPDSFNWIFFDCFNTLIDDFDEDGDASGLGPMQHLPVEAGLYDNIYEVRADYLDWRDVTLKSQSREIPLAHRLDSLLARRSPDYPVDQRQTLVQEMERCFAERYEDTLRLPQGVVEMLQYWQGKVSMDVVSNFHVADLPEKLLAKYGLTSYLDFVIDSAQCGYRKPNPEIYEIAAQKANISPENYHQILFIGDHLLNDVLSPQTFGMQSIYFDRSLERAKSAKAPANVCSIRNWSEFR